MRHHNTDQDFDDFDWIGGRRLRVFEKKVNGTTVGFIVGWQKWRRGQVKNVRADLFFPTKESAIAFRDQIEDARKALVTEITPVA